MYKMDYRRIVSNLKWGEPLSRSSASNERQPFRWALDSPETKNNKKKSIYNI